jgi:hypothetical protein
MVLFIALVTTLVVGSFLYWSYPLLQYYLHYWYGFLTPTPPDQPDGKGQIVEGIANISKIAIEVVVGYIPVVGPAGLMIYHCKEGKYVSALLDGAFVVLDVGMTSVRYPSPKRGNFASRFHSWVPKFLQLMISIVFKAADEYAPGNRLKKASVRRDEA